MLYIAGSETALRMRVRVAPDLRSHQRSNGRAFASVHDWADDSAPEGGGTHLHDWAKRVRWIATGRKGIAPAALVRRLRRRTTCGTRRSRIRKSWGSPPFHKPAAPSPPLRYLSPALSSILRPVVIPSIQLRDRHP